MHEQPLTIGSDRPVNLPKLEGEVATDQETIHEHSFDWSALEVVPRAVVFPRTTEDVRRLVDYVRMNKSRDPSLSITCRSAGTDVTGGVLNESIILDFMRYFTHLEVHGGHALVQPGVYYRDFDRSTMARGLFLPSAPESKDLCALGGMIANNSGGQKTLRYGKTKDYVEELQVVLQDGNEYVLGKISEQELEEKKRLGSFEGHVYREMHALLTERHAAIDAARPRVSKNSSGYNLWEIWDRENGTFDLSKVFVGSQGTLGVITGAKLRLVESKKNARILSIFVPDANALSTIIGELLPLDLEALEVYDRRAIVLLAQNTPALVWSLGWEAIPVGIKFLPDLLLFARKWPEFVLTAEFAEDTMDHVLQKTSRAKEILRGLDISYHEVRSKSESEKYHAMRKSSFPVLHGLKRLEPLTFIDDVIVPPSRLGEFIPRLRKILDDLEVKHAIIGHVGNGNLHVITLMDLESPNIVEKNDCMTHAVNRVVAEFGGSLSGEHNDGRVRGHFLERMYGRDIVGCFERTKEIFDPEGIFNPGNKIGVDWRYTLDHIRTERPHDMRPRLSRPWRAMAWAGLLALGLGATLAVGRRRRHRELAWHT